MTDDVEMVRVELYEEGLNGYGRTVNMTLPRVIDWLSGLLAKVPPEHRDSAVYEIDNESNYEGGYYTTLNIYYDRPITEAEIAARVAEASEYARKSAIEREAQERATYEALKAKFG